MGNKQSFDIGGHSFDTKAETQEYIKGILYRNELLKPLSESDFNFIIALLLHHPAAEQKIGCGIVSVQVRLDTEWGTTRQFILIRKDGTMTDFSYLKCLNGKIENKLELFKKAGRSAVAEQVLNFREDYFSKYQDYEGRIECQETAERISRQECHVDHHPASFDSIVNDFLASVNLDLNSIKYIGFRDGEQKKDFVDTELRKQFANFHKKKAALRIISIKANLTKKRRSF